jgi:hypothetical protein
MSPRSPVRCPSMRGLRIVIAIGACCTFGCSCRSTGTPAADSSADSGIIAARETSASTTDGSSEGSADGHRRSACECLPGSPAQPIGKDEGAVAGEVASRNWQIETLVPLCAEKLLCFGEHHILDQEHLQQFWDHYKIIRSSAAWPRCPRSIRVAVTFTSNSGANYWVATGPGRAEGPGTEYMETEDHVCHPLDAALFRDIVNMLGIRNDVLRDRDYGRFL